MSSEAPKTIEYYRLRKQRNVFATGAILALLISIGGSLPRFLKNHNEQKQLNEDLISLQSVIVTDQQATRETQAAILKAQQEITELMKRKK